MKKHTNILAQPHNIQLDKLHILISDNSIIDFAPSNPIRLKLKTKTKYNKTYCEIYEIHYNLNGKYQQVGYLNHRLRVKHSVSKITLTSKLLYRNWYPIAKTILCHLNVNEDYVVSLIENALDTNVDLLSRYYNMNNKKQIHLKDGYSHPVVISNANNRFNGIISGDTIYIEKIKKNGQINQCNKTRIEDKSNQLTTVSKPHISTKLSKVIDTSSPHFRIEQIINFTDYAEATRNPIFTHHFNPDDILTRHHYSKLSDCDKISYYRANVGISFDAIRLEDLTCPTYLLRLFNHFAKFNLSDFLGCPTIEPLVFAKSYEVYERQLHPTNFNDIFDNFE